MPPQEPAVPPGARGQFPTALSANAALIFGAGVLLGLLSGALLMRERLLRRQVAVGEYVPTPTLPQRQQPVAQQPVAQQVVDQQALGQQPVAQQAVELEAGGVSQTGATPEIRFAARLVPGETTIVLAPSPGADEVSIEHSSDHHA
jgi:hypothetical protein